MLTSLTGYRTWLGLAITIIGTFGLYEKLGLSKDDVSQIVDTAVTLAGLILAAYGNYQAHKK